MAGVSTSSWVPRVGTAPGKSPQADRLKFNARWRDPRMAVGVGLMAVSVVAATLVVSAADQRVQVWAAAHDLAAGTKLTADDLRPVAVSLDDTARYLGGDIAELVGRPLARDLGAGELVAISAIGSSSGPTRLVTLPVEPMHSPPALTHGDRVDVYVSPRENSATAASRLVLSNALVAETAQAERASGELAVVIDVEATAASEVVAAGRAGVIDLVRVPVSSR